jgi:hypothetical protein
MWYLCILTKAIMMLCLFFPTTKAYVKFIGREKARAYLQCIYCKVKPRIQRKMSHIIKSRCACVWMYVVDIWWNPNSILLLENISLLKPENIFAREQGLFYSSLFFSGGHLSTHCFQYFRHLSIFLVLFFYE